MVVVHPALSYLISHGFQCYQPWHPSELTQRIESRQYSAELITTFLQGQLQSVVIEKEKSHLSPSPTVCRGR